MDIETETIKTGYANIQSAITDRRKSGWSRVENNRQTFSSGDGYFFFTKKMIMVTTMEKVAISTALSWINKLIIWYVVMATPPNGKVTSRPPCYVIANLL